MKLTRLVRASGFTLVGAGILILLFVAFQLWGTGIYQSQHQTALRTELNNLLHSQKSPTIDRSLHSTKQSVSLVAPRMVAPQLNHPVGRLQIPAIGLDQVIIEGVAEDDLSLGPGHYPGTPLPGEAGNAAIAGHRTTWGHPFYNLNEVGPHDRIIITTVQGTFTYMPISQHVVSPGDVTVLDSSQTPELTLTTCNPRYSAAQRLVLVAHLTSSSVRQSDTSGKGSSDVPSEAPLRSSLDGLTPGGLDLPVTVGEGLGCVVIALLIALARYRVSRTSLRRLFYGTGLVMFLGVLFLFFSSISLSLPASF